MFRTLTAVVLSALGAASQQPGTTPEPAAPKPEDVRTVDDLIGYVQAHERTVKSVTMSIQTEGVFQDGSPFTTEGTLRVLGETHFQQKMTAKLGPDMEFETETVRTPDGVWMRERDPIQGEVYLHMDKALMARVQSASEAVGEAGGVGLDGRSESPLGSAMLRDIDRQFQLTLSGPKVIDRAECWVVAGPVRAKDDASGDVLGTGADRVDIVVRVADGAITSMTQFKEGRPLIQVHIHDLVLDPILEPESFVLSVPPRTELVDVMDHPPTQAQLQELFERAQEKGWKDPAEQAGDTPKDATGETPPPNDQDTPR